MKIKMLRDKRCFLLYTIIGSIVALMNTIFYNNMTVAIMLVIVEIAVLLFLLIQKKYAEYIVAYILFISPCIEFAGFAGTDSFFNLKNLRILGINLGIWALLPMFLLALINIKNSHKLKTKYKLLYKYSLGLIFINIVATIIGIMGIILNDNNVRSMEGYITSFVGEVYNMLFLPIALLASVFLSINYDEKNLFKIELGLQAVLISNVMQMVTSMVTGIMGTYGGTTMLMASTVYFYAPLMLAYVIYDKQILYRKFTILMSLLGTFLAMSYGANGKLIITTVVVFGIIIYSFLKDKNVIKKITAILILVITIIGIPVLFAYIAETNVLFKWKLTQATSLFSFGDDWLANLPESPKVRINEFINIAIEFSKKPWFILTGKGLIGTVKDYTGYWGSLALSTRSGAFTISEWKSGLFYSMHEITCIILPYGLMGIIYFVSYLKVALKNYRKSIWFVFGVYWLLLFYGYSFTLNVFGVCAFYYAFCKIPNKKYNKERYGYKK